jgi:hypothetical protein
MTTVDRQGWIGSAARFRFLSDEHISGAKAAFARFEQYRPRLPRIVEDQGAGPPIPPFL